MNKKFIKVIITSLHMKKSNLSFFILQNLFKNQREE